MAFPERDQAFAAEPKLKGGRKKEALIAGDWDKLRALSQERRG
ncbi:tRNA/rRNA methyltransferase [Novosphingobium nitrogenifigens DSM 19370]|uniref:tRNA/rRNA methyltransferase n=1 Tax=Novosphingobium nitrogenifigens DSM 19370 TaxID=983920 RepID=F1Z7W4_9SPHN|nr:hypothetical protein [Novosphingobium nitrogenifigens]EGD59261.1 tRNA/rRNA methyltransferase [Novosphingobium nitrogenifigens DSM 19370]